MLWRPCFHHSTLCVVRMQLTRPSSALCQLQPKHMCSGFAVADSAMVLGASESPDSQVRGRLTGFAVLAVVVVSGCKASACRLRGSGQCMLALHLGGREVEGVWCTLLWVSQHVCCVLLLRILWYRLHVQAQRRSCRGFQGLVGGFFLRLLWVLVWMGGWSAEQQSCISKLRCLDQLP